MSRRRLWFVSAKALSMVLCCLVLSISACNQDRAVAVGAMNNGLLEIKGGRTADGVKLLKEATQNDPTYADPPYYLGQIYHQKYNELDESIRYYRTAIERDEDNPQFYYRLGTVLAEKGSDGEAIGIFEKAVLKKQDFEKAWFRMGVSQIRTKKYTDAVGSLSKSIRANAGMKIGSDDPGGAAYHALGDLYLRFGFYDKALKVYENGIGNNAAVGQLYHGKGVAQLKLKRFNDAALSFEKSIGLDSRASSAYFNLAVAQHALGQSKAALKSLDLFLSRADPSKDSARMAAASGLRQELNAALEK